MSFKIIGDINSLSLEQLTIGFKEDRDTNKVTTWRGSLQVRPEYQRQFVYEEVQQKEVIYSILRSRPLGIMYFAKDGQNYEVMDGQQRIMSICKFRNGEFSIEWNGTVLNYDFLSSDDKEVFNNYNIKFYICDGDYQDKLQWFKTINIGGEPLSDQELRNALCGGDWIKTLKKTFSSKEYLSKYKELLPSFTGEDSKNLKRFVVLETVLTWLISYEGFTVDEDVKDILMAFMDKYKNSGEVQAKRHIDVFESICNFAKNKFNITDKTFQKYLKYKNINWGKLAKQGTAKTYDEIKAECNDLIGNAEVDRTGNICEYIIFGDKRVLYNRVYSEDKKIKIWMKQGGRCGNKNCPNPYVPLAECQAHHKIAFDNGGATTIENGVILCRACHKAWHNSDNSGMEFI